MVVPCRALRQFFRLNEYLNICIMEHTQASHFTGANVPLAPEDSLYGLMRAFREDSHDRKIDLGIGAYRDDDGKPWILPVVEKVSPAKLPGGEYFPDSGALLRPKKFCAMIQRPTMNTFPFAALIPSPLQLRSSF